MPVHSQYVANCSLLFTELPVLERPAAAAAVGLTAIEFWWPFPEPVPTDEAVDDFVSAVRAAGVKLVGLNFYAGDLAGPDCGVLSIPSRSQQFRDSIDVAVGIGGALGVDVFNALYGNRVEESSPKEQDELAVENLVTAAKSAASIGATVLIEAVSGPKPYPLRTAADAVGVVQRVRSAGVDNIAFLLDIFHLANNGDDPWNVIVDHIAEVAHVQIADFPGRGEPGTGELDIPGWLSALDDAGYTGRIALEYKPTTARTTGSLAWLPKPIGDGA